MKTQRLAARWTFQILSCCILSGVVQAQSTLGVLATRADLNAAESSANDPGSQGSHRNPLLAASIRQRLRDGDFQVGDRVVVTVVANAIRTDTLVVRAGRILELRGQLTVPLAGVLRSEIQERVAAEVLKYVKAEQVIVVPLMRIGILGEVAHPGYFALASDVPLTDAIMGAGGPAQTADLSRSIVKRGNQEFRSAKETREAIARGFTLDQFGLSAGDEVIVGRHRDFISSSALALVGAAASLVTIFVALHH